VSAVETVAAKFVADVALPLIKSDKLTEFLFVEAAAAPLRVKPDATGSANKWDSK